MLYLYSRQCSTADSIQDVEGGCLQVLAIASPLPPRMDRLGPSAQALRDRARID